MLGIYVDLGTGNRAVVQVFEGTSGVDVKKVSALNKQKRIRSNTMLDQSRVHWPQLEARS
jgi:vacuolar-type H+-ATPase subunit B/Vma2